MMEKKEKIKVPEKELKEKTKTTLIIFSIIYFVSLAVWVLPAAFALISAGGPSPFKNPLMRFLGSAFFICLLLYPVFTILSGVVSWVCYKKNNFQWASKAMFIPLGYIAVGFLLYILFIVVAVFVGG
jgi:hypothetical protein